MVSYCVGMRGSIRVKKPGTWELVVDIGRDPLTRRRRQRSRTFHGTKREAERELRRLVTSVEDGRLTGTDVVVADLLGRWLELASDQLSPTTIREYRRLVEKRIGPAIGSVPLTKLTTAQLDEFYQALTKQAGLAPASVRQIHSIIRRGLRQGVKWGWIEHNVAVNATPPVLRSKRIEPPSLDMIRSLISAAEAYDPSFGVLVRIAIATGLRRGELCGLRWIDIDLDQCRLHVRRSVAAIPGGATEKSTKTGTSRKLSIDVATAQQLGDHLRRMEDRAASADELLLPDGYLFSHSPDGSTPWHPDNVTGAFRRLPPNQGNTRFHDLRHAHATQLLARGVDVTTVSGRLGHANSSTTLNIYAHVLDEKDHAAAELIGELLE